MADPLRLQADPGTPESMCWDQALAKFALANSQLMM